MSQAATTESKANELIDALTRLDQSELFDELAVGRLSRDARALMKADAAGAHTVLGGIAGIEGDAARVHEHYEIALKLSGRTTWTLGNCATALVKAGALDGAFKAIMEAHERTPDNPEILGLAISTAVQGGRFRESRSLYERRSALQPNRRTRDETQIRLAANAIDRGAFTESAAQKVILIAQHVRLAAKVRQAGSSLHSVHGEPDRFSFVMYVYSSTRQAVDLNTEFADRIVSDEALMTDPGLKFVPMFMGKSVHDSDTRAAP